MFQGEQFSRAGVGIVISSWAASISLTISGTSMSCKKMRCQSLASSQSMRTARSCTCPARSMAIPHVGCRCSAVSPSWLPHSRSFLFVSMPSRHSNFFDYAVVVVFSNTTLCMVVIPPPTLIYFLCVSLKILLGRHC